jgi:hypothetical protein
MSDDRPRPGPPRDAPPQRLDYYSPTTLGRDNSHPLLKFIAGLLLGSAVSAIVWAGGWKYVNDGRLGFLIWVVPLLKLGVSIACFFNQRWRAFGLGLLLSIGIGLLIFFSVCAANFRM